MPEIPGPAFEEPGALSETVVLREAAFRRFLELMQTAHYSFLDQA
jgi:hypothetical protein